MMRARAAAVAVAVMLLASSCTIRESDNYKVTAGTSIHTEVYGRTTFAITNIIYSQTCRYDLGCLFLKMVAYTHDENNFKRMVEYGDGWVENVRYIESVTRLLHLDPSFCLKNSRGYLFGNPGGQWSRDALYEAASCILGQWPSPDGLD